MPYIFEVFRNEPSPRWHLVTSRADPREVFGDTMVRNVRQLIEVPELSGSYAADGGTLAVDGKVIALATVDVSTWRRYADYLCQAGNQYTTLRASHDQCVLLREERVQLQDENEGLRVDLRRTIALLKEAIDAYDRTRSPNPDDNELSGRLNAAYKEMSE